MAKRAGGFGLNKTKKAAHTHKTAKRLEAKRLMIEEKKSKKHK
jgi:hypothetical protein